MTARLWVQFEKGCLRAKEEALVLLLSKMRVNVLKRGLLRNISNFFVDPLAAILDFARADDIYWTASECVDWFCYEFEDAAIVFVSGWLTKSLKQCLRGDALARLAEAKVASRYLVVS